MTLRLVLLFLALLVPAAAGQRVDPAQDSRVLVLLLGDSISQGYHEGVVDLLGNDFRVLRPMHRNGRSFENCEGTTKGVKEIDRWLALEGGGWDIIHFNFGLHDLKRVDPDTRRNSNNRSYPRQAELEIYVQQLTHIIDRLEREGAKLIFATTTPVPLGVRPYRENDDVLNYNAAARELMESRGIEINDLYAKVVDEINLYQNDRDVHFKPEGSSYLAHCVHDVIFRYSDDHVPIKWLDDPWRYNREVFIIEVTRGLKRWIPLTMELRNRGEDLIRKAVDIDASYAREVLATDLWPATDRFGRRGRGSLHPMSAQAERVRILQRDGYSIEHLLIESR
ncbi:MAG: SGNH/GDSL hydrolase family protein, partial [Planctomycetes bacterium]|nr:SGNH/GDSL hydrolase family protein [Planctomycetota bacterium]